MAKYLSPGVYIEEIDAGPKPIEGVSTSICGAVGMTVTGPTSGKPVLVTSFNEFTQNFGGYWAAQDQGTVNTWTASAPHGGSSRSWSNRISTMAANFSTSSGWWRATRRPRQRRSGRA